MNELKTVLDKNHKIACFVWGRRKPTAASRGVLQNARLMTPLITTLIYALRRIWRAFCKTPLLVRPCIATKIAIYLHFVTFLSTQMQ